MGSSLSRIYEDMDDYSSLCEKYGEKEQDIYTNHYYWLKDRHRGITDLSFKDYSFQKDKENAKNRIAYIENQINNLKKEKDELKKIYDI